jgi:hypothetical protein
VVEEIKETKVQTAVQAVAVTITVLVVLELQVKEMLEVKALKLQEILQEHLMKVRVVAVAQAKLDKMRIKMLAVTAVTD